MARKHGSGARIQFCRIRLENNWKDFGQNVFERDGQGMGEKSQYGTTLKIPIKTHRTRFAASEHVEHHDKGEFLNVFRLVRRKRAFIFVV